MSSIFARNFFICSFSSLMVFISVFIKLISSLTDDSSFLNEKISFFIKEISSLRFETLPFTDDISSFIDETSFFTIDSSSLNDDTSLFTIDSSSLNDDTSLFTELRSLLILSISLTLSQILIIISLLFILKPIPHYYFFNFILFFLRKTNRKNQI